LQIAIEVMSEEEEVVVVVAELVQEVDVVDDSKSGVASCLFLFLLSNSMSFFSRGVICDLRW